MDKERYNQWQRNIRARLKAMGLCVDCRDVAAKHGHVLCEDCLAQRRRRIFDSQRVKAAQQPKPPMVDASVEKMLKIAHRLMRASRYLQLTKREVA